MKKLLMAAILIAGLCITVTAADADLLFEAIIEQGQEPPHPGPAGTGSPGVGYGLIRLNSAEDTVTYNITFAGLLAPESASHFHNAPKDVQGGVVKNLPAGSPKVGTWTTGDITQPLTPALVAELKAGNLYINIHSTQFPGGEIRGQVVPEPSSLVALAASSMGLLGAVRRRQYKA